MLIDRHLPDYDVSASERVVVDAEPAQVWTRAMDADLRWRPRGRHMRLGGLGASGSWIQLDEDFGRELVVGAVGHLRGPRLRWRQSIAAEFASFDEPGYTKLALNLTVQPYGDGRTVLSCEARCAGTDRSARRRLLRRWRAASPLLGMLARHELRGIRDEAERQFGDTVPRPSQYRRRG